MLLAALALLAAQQQTFDGLGWKLDYPADRWIAQEFSEKKLYTIEFLSRSNPQALHPPLRIQTSVEKRVYSKSSDWATAAAEDFQYLLRQRGLKPGEIQSKVSQVIGNYQSSRYFHCTLEDGSKWVYTFHAQNRPKSRAVLFSWAQPDAEGSMRKTDLKKALDSMEGKDFHIWDEIQYNVFGLLCPLPVIWESKLVANETQAYLRGEFGSEVMELRVFHVGDENQAIAAAEKFHKSLPEEIPVAVAASGKDYEYKESVPARFAVGPKTVLGWRSLLHGKPGSWGGWRYDAVIPVKGFVVNVTVVALANNYDKAMDRFTQTLKKVGDSGVSAQIVTTICDGLKLRHDSGLQARRSETPTGVRYDFVRVGVNDELGDDQKTGVQKSGSLWLEFRGDLSPGDALVNVQKKFHARHFKRKASSNQAKQFPLFGQQVRGEEGRYYGQKKDEENEILLSFITWFTEKEHLVVAYRGPYYTRPELEGLLIHIMTGISLATGPALVSYEAEGVTYSVDPKLWTVRTDPSARSSTATMRNTTMTVEWMPLVDGLLGPPPAMGDALTERVEMHTLGWALEGDVGEVIYGDAAFGADASVPAKYAALRRTDADGKQWDQTWMVGDVNGRRCWAVVTTEVSDVDAFEAVSAVLATVLPR